jgi:hypothetical protein
MSHVTNDMNVELNGELIVAGAGQYLANFIQ